MREIIIIGENEFGTKKEALNHYKTILNFYEFGEILNGKDFLDIINLLKKHPRVKEMAGAGIEKVRVARSKYNTKSFELVRVDDSTEFFSYTKRINSPKSDFTRFSEACRKAVQEDLRNVKLVYFEKFSKKGFVKCQESGVLSKWEDLNVDHRQPNTFSVIVDRFIELKMLDLKIIEYKQIDGGPNEFTDGNLREEFRQYHSNKANLRIVRKNVNISRSFQARINGQKKDLKIKLPFTLD